MAVKRVVSVRAENGASVPPPMDPSEKMLGMEWSFSGVSTGHTDGVKPPTFYHTYQLVEPDEVPMTSEQLRTLEQVKALRGEHHPLRILQRERIRAWFLDTSAPMGERKTRLMALLPLDFVQLASKIEIDGVCLKDRGSALPSPIPGEVCSTCDGNSSACPVCNPTDPPEGYLD